MTLLDHLPATDGWTIECVASDLSTRVLDVAARGEYDVEKALEIHAPYLRRFMLRGIGARAGFMSVGVELRRAMRFLRVNLHESPYPVPGTFDLVFCSNALIYFSRAGQVAVVERLTERLVPDGHLFVGHAESLHTHRAFLRPVAPTVYQRTDSANRERTRTAG